MNKKNSLLVLPLLFVLTNNLVALEISSDLSTRLKANNGYLDKNKKSDTLAHIMIYYTDIKCEISGNDKLNKPRLNELVSLMSKYKNNSFAQSYSLAETNLKETNSPVAFFNKIK